MLIAEDVLLLLTDDDEGVVSGDYPDLALGAALLLELALIGRIRITEKGEALHRAERVVVESQQPTDDLILDEALARLVAHPDCKPQRAVEVLSKKVRRPLLERLVGREILRQDATKVLGLWPRTTWPTNDPTYERHLRQQLFSVLVEGEKPDVRMASVIALLSAMKVAHKVVAQDVSTVDKRAVRRRAEQLRRESWASEAARKAIEATEAAAVAAITATAVASS